jgi:hypothetical protein
MKRIKTSGDSTHRSHSSTGLSHDDNTKLDQGSSAQICIEKSVPCRPTVNQNYTKILDIERINGFVNTTESSIDAGYHHDRS